MIQGNHFCTAEVEWICEHEFAPHLLDVVCRRTEISLYVHHSKTKEIASAVGKIMQKIYQWDDEKLNIEIQSYVDYVNNWLWF